MKSSDYRIVAHSVLRDRGFDVQVDPGQGYLPGSRVIARKARQKITVAVKASQQRAVSFTKQENGRWRTLHAVDLVIGIVPSRKDPGGADVYGFERKPLERAFNRAWKELEANKRPVGFNIPVFIPLDTSSFKKVGHTVNNLAESAKWNKHLTAEELERRAEEEESYVDQFRRRFAADNSVEPEQVMISIMGKLK